MDSTQGTVWIPHRDTVSGLQRHNVAVPQRDSVSCSHRKWENLDKNHENLSESGRRESVWGDNLPESFLQGLGSLWDASRPLKPP